MRQMTVQSYFPVQPGSDLQHFAAIADRYPVFELLPLAVRDRKTD